MLDIGRVCVKIAGREAGNRCVVVDRIDDNFVLIDGNVRRKKCNVLHLEPLGTVLKIKKGADTKTVLDAMKKEGIEVFERKPKKEKKPLIKPGKEIQKTPAKETKKAEEKPAKKEPKKKSLLGKASGKEPSGKKETSAKAEKKKK